MEGPRSTPRFKKKKNDKLRNRARTGRVERQRKGPPEKFIAAKNKNRNGKNIILEILQKRKTKKTIPLFRMRTVARTKKKRKRKEPALP
jgi:hypothetical protein